MQFSLSEISVCSFYLLVITASFQLTLITIIGNTRQLERFLALDFLLPDLTFSGFSPFSPSTKHL
jgi:hypothetical protein